MASIAAPASGPRTFSGLINVAAQPATLAGFGDLSLVTKSYVSTADASIATNLSTELVARASADASIASGLSSELVARASAITSEASTRLAADNSIASGLSSELVNRASAVSSEESLRAVADASIATNLSTEKSRIDAILLASDADKDSFAEIVTLINSVDTTNDNAFAGYVLSNDAALSTELVARASADVSIAANLSSELVDRASAVSTEASLRVVGDDSIAANLSSEISNRISDVNDEQARAESAELSLSNLLGADLSTEISNRIADVNAEESRATSAELVLTNNLSSEISRAESAEGSIAIQLSSEVSYIIANTDLTSIDSFAEVVADMSSEISRAESAEASIALDFANIYSKRVAIVETPNGVITEFTLAIEVREDSELIYMNGLLLDSGDYTASITDGMVTAFTMLIAPSTGDKVHAYGVC